MIERVLIFIKLDALNSKSIVNFDWIGKFNK